MATDSPPFPESTTNRATSVYFKTFCFLICVGSFFCGSVYAESNPQKCSYATWTWDTVSKKAVDFKKVHKYKSELQKTESDPHSSCTICEEDQEWIRINGIAPFRACKYFAEQIRTVIQSSLDQGFPIYQVIGYRVGKTKGKTDPAGLRTKYSHHSFGTAIDINPEFNGLYDNCTTFAPSCRLRLGGEWRADNPASVKKGSPIYEEFKNMGWRWGGELKGKQKDFMHFSISGD